MSSTSSFSRPTVFIRLQVCFFFLLGGMKEIPTREFDVYMNIIEVFGPKNNLAIGPIFADLKELQVLRIVDSNVPAVGRHSFWGLQKLRVLGKFFFFT